MEKFTRIGAINTGCGNTLNPYYKIAQITGDNTIHTLVPSILELRYGSAVGVVLVAQSAGNQIDGCQCCTIKRPL